MGIHGLMALLKDECPVSTNKHEFKHYTDRKIAIDASLTIYQFLIAIRSTSGASNEEMQLMSANGEVTSHIQGLFNKTIKMLTSGMKPVYVFDGTPPVMKNKELMKRKTRKSQYESELLAAKTSEDFDDVNKFSRRLVNYTDKIDKDCKELLRLMGIPVIQAPCEAEAQCAELAKKGKVYATATEDMDALAFGSPRLMRNVTFSHASAKDKFPINEINFSSMLSGLRLTYDQFVDLCILCGCDYCSTIPKIGPKTALKLIRAHKSIENIIDILQKDKKYQIPYDWFEQRVTESQLKVLEMQQREIESKNSRNNNNNNNDEHRDYNDNETDDGINDDNDILFSSGYTTNDVSLDTFPSVSPTNHNSNNNNICNNNTKISNIVSNDINEEIKIIPPRYIEARKLFHTCEVIDGNSVTIQQQMKWQDPDEAGLKTFLVDRFGFNPDRVNAGLKRLKDSQGIKTQKRIDSFFAPSSNKDTNKRKADEI